MSVARRYKVERIVADSDSDESKDIGADSSEDEDTPVRLTNQPLQFTDIRQIAPEPENDYIEKIILSPRSVERRVPLGKSAPNIRPGTVVPTAADSEDESDLQPPVVVKLADQAQEASVPPVKEWLEVLETSPADRAQQERHSPARQSSAQRSTDESQPLERKPTVHSRSEHPRALQLTTETAPRSTPPASAAAAANSREVQQPMVPFQPQRIPVTIQEAISNTVVVVSNNFPRLLLEGSVLWKIPFNGRGEAKKRWIRVKTGAQSSADGMHTVNVRVPHDIGQNEGQVVAISFPPTICWLDPEKPSDFHSARELAVDASSYVATGHRTPAFWRMASKRQASPAEKLCFSVITTERTLDFAADSTEQAQQWVAALTLLAGIAGGKYDVSPRAHFDVVPPSPYDHRASQSASSNHIRQHSATEESQARQAHSLQTMHQELLKFASIGNANGVLECLTMGCAVDIMDPTTGDTALLVACRHGRANIAQICLDYGARNDPHPDFGQTALHAAVSAGHVDCAKAILDTASPSGADHVVANLADPRKQTPLHVACEMGNITCIELLLSHGADMSMRRFDSRSPIHICCAEGHRAALSVLLSFGGDHWIEEVDADGNTALHLACLHGHLPCVRLLLETAANPLIINKVGLLPYQLASSNGHHQVGLLLLEYNPAAAGSRDVLQRRRSHRQLNRAVSEDLIVDVNDRGNPWSAALTRGSSASSVDVAALPRPHSRFSNHSGPASPADFRSPHSFTSSPVPRGSQYPQPTAQWQSSVFTWDTPNGYEKPISTQDRAQAIPASSQPQPWHQSNQQSHLDQATLMNMAMSSAFSATVSDAQAHHTPAAEEQVEETLDVAGIQFTAAGYSWTEYYTEENYAYFLCNDTGHSQWEDPRESGIVEYDDVAETSDATTTPSNETTADPRYNSPNKPKSPNRRPSPRVGRSPNTAAGKSHSTPPRALDTSYAELSKMDAREQVSRPIVDVQNGDSADFEIATTASPKVGLSSILPSAIVPHTIVTSASKQSEPESAEPKQSSSGRSALLASIQKRGEMSSCKSAGKTEAVAQGESKDSSEPKQPAKDSMASDAGKESITAQVKEEVKIPEKYLKMAKVGVAIPNILQKMMAEGCSPKEIDMAQETLESARQPLAADRESKITSQAPETKTEPEAKQPANTAEAPSKYLKMAKMGIPPPAVIQKMRTDECSKEEIAAVEVALGLPSSAAIQQPRPTATMEDLAKDEELSKFLKMMKMGVPAAAVELKMQAEGLNREKIDMFVSVVDPSRAPRGSSSPAFKQRGKTLPTLKVHWDTIQGDKLEKSVWATPRSEQKSELQADQIQELTSLFAAKPTTQQRTSVQPAKRRSVIQPQAIDGKRANNVAIGLVQFKAFASHDALFELVCSLSTGAKLDSEKLENLRTLLPTQTELKSVAALDESGELHQTEKFFKAAARHPNLDRRIDAALFIDNFQPQFTSVAERVQRLLEICDRVMNSNNLAQVLQKMLAVGNVMNQGTRKGDASGFTLDSLLKLINTKGVDRKTTVLDYVVRLIYDGGDAQLLRLPDDLAGSDVAQRDCMSGIAETITNITTKHDQFVALAQREVERLDFDPSNASKDELEQLEGEQLYLHRLQVFLSATQSQADSLGIQKQQLEGKYSSLAEYFGEDHTCRPEQIFGVLVQFKSAFEQSVQIAERRAKIKKRQLQQQGGASQR